MSCPNPCRKMGWSSTMSILYLPPRPGLFADMRLLPFLSEGASHRCAATRIGLDPQRCSDHAGTVVHDPQTYAGGLAGVLDPDTVIENGKRNVSIVVQEFNPNLG